MSFASTSAASQIPLFHRCFAARPLLPTGERQGRCRRGRPHTLLLSQWSGGLYCVHRGGGQIHVHHVQGFGHVHAVAPQTGPPVQILAYRSCGLSLHQVMHGTRVPLTASLAGSAAGVQTPGYGVIGLSLAAFPENLSHNPRLTAYPNQAAFHLTEAVRDWRINLARGFFSEPGPFWCARKSRPRSNSASRANMPNMSLPAVVVVSNCSDRETKSTLRTCNRSLMLRMSRVLRPRRDKE